MKSWQRKEIQARRAIEDQGFVAHDANVLFRANCPNIDLVVLGMPAELEKLLIPSARTFADRPKRDGKQRSIAFRKELPREALKPWLNAWQQLGEPQGPAAAGGH